jgi:hypothetical protein
MSDGPGIPEKHPEFIAMTAAIFSAEGQALAIKASSERLPALAGLDQMLTEVFARYRDKNQSSLQNAGFIVARLMRDKLGYSQGKSVPCPAGCTARNGTLFSPPGASN